MVLRYALLASAASQSVLAPFAAQAQTAPAQDTAGSAASETARPDAAQDIVVTATRREERLIDIPLSIQAVSCEDPPKPGAVNFADYARNIAGDSFLYTVSGRLPSFFPGGPTRRD